MFKTILFLLSALLSIHVAASGYSLNDNDYMNGYLVKKYADFRFAAENWDAKTQYKEGVSYYKGRGYGYEDLQRAHILFTLASNKGHTYSSVYLGQMFEKGVLGSVDYPLAEKYYLRAARKNYKDAIEKLANWYAAGVKVDGKYVIQPDARKSESLKRKLRSL